MPSFTVYDYLHRLSVTSFNIQKVHLACNNQIGDLPVFGTEPAPCAYKSIHKSPRPPQGPILYEVYKLFFLPLIHTHELFSYNL